MKHVVVIGGGVGGLSTAYFLQEQAREQGVELRVTILEARDRWGGVTSSSTQDGFTLEHGPDSVIRTKPAGMALFKKLGLDEKLVGTNPALTGSLIVRGTKLIPIPKGLYLLAPGRMLPFALSPMMTWRGKLRTGLDLILPRRAAGAPEESLAQFVRRRLGQESLERIAQPLVGGIYTADPEHLSLSHCMPQFLEMEQEHRSLIWAMRKRANAMKKQAQKSQQASGAVSGARYGLFVSCEGGLQTMIAALVTANSEAEMCINSPVTSLERTESGYELQVSDEKIVADAVVLAVQAQPAALLSKNIHPELSEDLASIPYASVATVNIAFKKSQIKDLPDAAGFVVPAVEGRHMIACTFSSVKYDNRAPEDGVLLRAFVGGAMHEGHLNVSDETMTTRIISDLRDWLKVEGEPLFSTVHRYNNAMAQPLVGHAQILKRIRSQEQRLDGFALVGNGYEGVGIPDIVAQGEDAAQRIISAFAEL